MSFTKFGKFSAIISSKIFFCTILIPLRTSMTQMLDQKKTSPYVPKACIFPHCLFCLFYRLDNFHCSYFTSLDSDLISNSLTPTSPSPFYYGAHPVNFYFIQYFQFYYLHLILFIFYSSTFFLLRTPIFPFISTVFTLSFMIIQLL